MMDSWLQTCLLLCLFGFFKALRPTEPFLTEYLVQPPMNLTYDEVRTGELRGGAEGSEWGREWVKGDLKGRRVGEWVLVERNGCYQRQSA